MGSLAGPCVQGGKGVAFPRRSLQSRVWHWQALQIRVAYQCGTPGLEGGWGVFISENWVSQPWWRGRGVVAALGKKLRRKRRWHVPAHQKEAAGCVPSPAGLCLQADVKAGAC